MQLSELLKSFNIYYDEIKIASEFVALDMFDGEFVGQCSPIFRWVGGKSQLLSVLKFYSPQKYNTYFEPFLGGGALLFSLMPKKAVVNDVNPVIINLYKDVKYNYNELVCVLKSVSRLPDTENVFFTVRDIFNSYLKQNNFTSEMSALFLYLNAKAFNGLYRVNGKGEFNVGYAKESVRPHLYVPETLQYVHNYLQNNQVDILSGDFLKCTEKASEGDFVYFDPPYIPVSGTKNFTGYSQDKFDMEQQEKLANEFKRLTSIGVKCILSNSDCDLIHDLYNDYTIKTLNVNYYIQPTSDDIKRQECLVLNF